MVDRKGRSSEDKFPYKKGHCRVCGNALPPRRRTFCGRQECFDEFYMKTRWNTVREKVYKRDKGICQICGADLTGNKKMGCHVDHIVPICKGGSEWNLDNLQLTCAPCNLKKGGK